ncbi:Ig-like domain-containing protein [Methanolobus sp. ZRKC5]|uniref:Ig-like domain-containing protein n=1 Tax=unclassified Methanolobus TaxID=2629569 RepID=UPI00313A92FB
MSISIILSTFSPMIIASAASGETVFISSDKVNPGDDAHVVISIENCENVTGMDLTLVYNQSIIDLNNMSINATVGSGEIKDTNTSGTVEIKLRKLDNLTDVGLVPLIDLTFDALKSGNSTLELRNVELLGGETPSILGGTDDEYILVEETIAINTAPKFGTIDSQFVNESSELSFTLNATDPDGDTLLFGKNVSYGNITGDVFTWTPTTDDVGTHYINFSVNDSALWDYHVVMITVSELVEETNNAPDFGIIGDKFVNESSELSFTLNATDLDGDALLFGKNVSYGNITGDVFTWTPTTDDIGTHYINFSVNDSALWDYHVVMITVSELVEETNNAPEFGIIGDKFVNESSELSFTLNATDPDGDTLLFGKNVSYGNITGDVFTWTPTTDDVGTHYINFSVNDSALWDYHVVMITVSELVEETNSAPEFGIINDQSINESEDFSLTLNATDPDGDDLTYYMSGLPEDANLNSATGVFSWKPGYNDSNIYDVMFNVSDGFVNVSETIRITVINIDQAPEFSYSIGNRAVNEAELINFTINATDPDNDTVIYSVVGLPDEASLDPGTGYFSWTPDHDASGIYNVELIATANGLNDTEAITITVNNVNREPVLADIGSYNVQENKTLEFSLSATDADNDSLSYDMSYLPLAATLNSTTGAFSWTPDYESSETYTVQFTVSDGNDTASQYVQIIVENTNRAPEFPEFGTLNATEGSELTLDISAFDPDHNSLTYSANVLFGTISGNEFIWTPDYSDSGTHDIEFTVVDKYLDYDTSIVTIEVGEFNRAPSMNPVSPFYICEVGEVISFNLVATDPDGHSITYSVSGLPESANSSLDMITGAFEWTPTYADEDKVYYAEFTAFDGDKYVSVETVFLVGIKLSWDDIGPKQVNEGENLSIVLNGSSNDTEITYFASGLPTGSTFDNVNGIFNWTPSYDQSGIHNATFGMKVGTSQIKETVFITVVNVNRAPSFNMDEYYVVNESEKLNILLNATDPDIEDTTLIFNSNVSFGSISGDVFTWTPGYTANQTSNGTYYINFTATDGQLSNSTIVTVQVFDVNAPPVLSPIGSQSIAEEKELVTNLAATDVDGDVLTFSALNLPENATLNIATGVFSWTPITGEDGTSIIFKVSDGEYNDTETVTITVTKSSSTSLTSSSSSGGGGGGGGSLSSGEKYENIIFKDYALKAVAKDTETVFSFYKENNSIVSLSFTSKLNGGQVKAVVEVLMGTSSQVSSSAPGNVYENMNLYIGSKLGSDAIGNSKVNFKVEKSWIDDNDFDTSIIVLYRYFNDDWAQLPTEMTGNDEYYYYFTSTTPGFSPFAISGADATDEFVVEEVVTGSTDTEDTVMSTEDAGSMELTTETTQESKSSLSFVFVLALVGIMVIGVFGYRNRDYYGKLRMQLGNPDGKRYRRVKK